MQDGIHLATDVYFPAESSVPYPVILMRPPYNKDFLEDYGRNYSEHDYIVAIQNVRGRYSSEGSWTPFVHEGQDGYDSIEWLAAQDWCTGKIGMLGGSYSGSVQFLAAIKRPHLVTIIPNITPARPFDNLPYDGGAMLLGWAIRWTGGHNEMESDYLVAKQRVYHTKKFPSHLVLPLIDPALFSR
jgi:putative CocE/NonD family hydrolase